MLAFARFSYSSLTPNKRRELPITRAWSPDWAALRAKRRALRKQTT